MKFGELLNAFCGKEDGSYILLSLEGVDKKDQTVSADAYPLLDAIKEWHVPYFDIVDDKLWVKVEPNERPF